MEIERLNKPAGVISNLANKPNLTAAELKAKFDTVPDYILNYINNILIPAIENGTPTKLSDLADDYKVNNAKHSEQSDSAERDSNGNKIADTYATLIYVAEEIAKLVDSSPQTLDTLREISAALNDDPNHTETMLRVIGEKANKTDVEAICATKEELSAVEIIADSKNKVYIFKEEGDLHEWCRNSENQPKLNVGDLLLTEREDQDNFFWNGSSESYFSYQAITISDIWSALSGQYSDIKNLYDNIDEVSKSVPTKISQLTDDTTEDKRIKYAEYSLGAGWASGADYADFTSMSQFSECDYEGNKIIDTYATKAELTEAIGEALEEEY